MAEEKPKTKTKKPSALKRILQSKKKAVLNKQYLSKTKTALKSFVSSLQDKDLAKKNLSDIFSLLDKGVQKNIIKRNKSIRLKSRYTKLLNK